MVDTITSSVDEFLDTVQASGLVSDTELRSWRGRRGRGHDAKSVAKEMILSGLLTKYQANRLLEKKHRGFVIGAYTILNLLEEGKDDAVFLASHGAMKHRVALKILKQNHDGGQVTHERFMREAHIMSSLNHPNIVKMFDFVEEAGKQCLIMEHVEGRTLKLEVEQEGPLPPDRALECIRQAAMGLGHAHAQGIMHRDVKPSNIMVTLEGTVKVLDMGHSRFSDDEKMNITKMYNPNMVVGSVDFVAPEQALGEDYDHRCDLYSLGATLFYLLTGKVPYKGTPYQVLMAHQLEPVPTLKDYLPRISSRVQTILDKLMAKSLRERYQSAEEVIQAITTLQKMAQSGIQVPKLPTAAARGATRAAGGSRPGGVHGSRPMQMVNTKPELVISTVPMDSDATKEIIRRASGGMVLPVASPVAQIVVEPKTGKGKWWLLLGAIGVAVVAGVWWWLKK